MGSEVKLFRDIETGEIITTEELFCEYNDNVKDDGRGLMFSEWTWNCMVCNGGTLETIDTTKR